MPRGQELGVHLGTTHRGQQALALRNAESTFPQTQVLALRNAHSKAGRKALALRMQDSFPQTQDSEAQKGDRRQKIIAPQSWGLRSSGPPEQQLLLFILLTFHETQNTLFVWLPIS